MISSPRVHRCFVSHTYRHSLSFYMAYTTFHVQAIKNELYCTDRELCPSLITMRSTDQCVDHHP